MGMTEEDRKRLKGSGGGNEAPSVHAKWWPITESPLRYGISTSTTRRFIAEGIVDARKVGSRTIINDDSMDRCIATQPRAVIKPDRRSAKLARRATIEEPAVA